MKENVEISKCIDTDAMCERISGELKTISEAGISKMLTKAEELGYDTKNLNVEIVIKNKGGNIVFSARSD